MKKIVSVLLGALLGATMLLGAAACNGGGSNNTATSTSNSVTIVVNSTFQNVYQPMFDAFEEQTGYQVDALWAADVTGQQDTMIGARNYPDIIVGGDMHMAKYSRILLDLSFLKEDADYDFDDFYDQLIAPLEEDGKLLFVPRFFNTGLLYYNKDIITDPNDYPTDEWTYEKFFEVAQKYSRNLTSSTEQDRYYGVALDNFYWGEWATLVRQSGGELMNDDGYITLDTDAAKQGIELFAKNSFGFVGDDVYTGELQPYSSSDRAYETINSGNGARIAPDAREMGFEGFGSGRYAFQYGGHTQNIPIYRNMDAQNNNLDFDVALLPLVKGQSGGYSRSGGELSIDALGIYEYTDAYDAAVAFIKFMTGKDGIRMQAAAGYMPPRQSIASELLAVPKAERPAPQNLEAVFDSLNYNEILPNVSYFVDVMQSVVQLQFGELMNRVATVETVAEQATSLANQQIQLMYK